VLITGGTKGIGLATGIAFGRRGAQVTLTHKSESADTQAVRSAFAEAGAHEPRIIDADASDIEVFGPCSLQSARPTTRLHTFVSNVAHAPVVRALDDYNRRDLVRSIDYSAWPLVSHVQAIKEIFGSYPKYVLAMSSAGAESYLPNYDIMRLPRPRCRRSADT